MASTFSTGKKPPRAFLDRFGDPYVICGLDPTGRNARSAEDSLWLDWNDHRLPYLDVIDGNGFVVQTHWGPLTEQAIETKILPAIEDAKIPYVSPTMPATEASPN